SLAEHVKALRNLAEMRRALTLQEWRAGTGADELNAGSRQALTLLVERFKKDLRGVLKQGSTDGRLAVLDMLAEMGPNLLSPDQEDQRGIARTFTADLAELVRSGETAKVRMSAARAL